MSEELLQVGQVIKKLRKKMSITGEELGRRMGWSQSKISKIETGTYPGLSQADAKKLLNILNSPPTIRQHVLSTINELGGDGVLLANYFMIHPNARDGSPERQADEHESGARMVKIYTAHAVPALLQTIEYRTVSLQRKGSSSEDVAKIIMVTHKRQDKLWESGRKFHLLMPETALYTFTGSRKVQLGQLDRLERSIGIPSLKFGIIPLEAGLLFIENGSFSLYDDQVLVQGLSRHEAATRDREEISMHHKLFESLSNLASYDDNALQLIRKAVNYFS